MKRPFLIIIAIFIFNCQASPQLQKIYTHYGAADNIKFSPDGKYVVTYAKHFQDPGYKNEMKLWATQTGDNLMNLEAGGIFFSADSRYLASYGTDKKEGYYFLVDLMTMKRNDSINGKYGLYCFYADSHTYIGFDWYNKSIVFIDPDTPGEPDIEPIPALQKLKDPGFRSIQCSLDGTVFIELSQAKKKESDQLELVYSFRRHDADARLLYSGKRGDFKMVISPGGKYFLAGADGDLVSGSTGEIVRKGFAKDHYATGFGHVFSFSKGDSLLYHVSVNEDLAVYRVGASTPDLKSSAWITGNYMRNSKGTYPVDINPESDLYAFEENDRPGVYIGRASDGFVTVGLDDYSISNPIKTAAEEAKRKEEQENTARAYYYSHILKPTVTPSDNVSSLQVGSWFKLGNNGGRIAMVTRISNGEVYFKFNNAGAEEKWSNYSLISMHILASRDVIVCSSCKGGLKNCWYCGGKGKTPVAGSMNISTEVHDHNTWYYTIETTTITGGGWETCKYCKGNGKERIINNRCATCEGRGWLIK